ncbi:hypothetical protein NE237_011569 [Protea cynaroides]|uniref:Uncharacterized protein n=1 Tax=Protea cynaroides TaxID=273540 RepID=A0A9Q0GV69_9MAGN|nr:hypothetical protein NE237_011569 [Protea cynaroides]
MEWLHCAQSAGLLVEIVHYDQKAVGIDAKKAFPFSNMHFYAEPRTGKNILCWSCTLKDLKENFNEYVKIGQHKKPMKFVIDDMILDFSASKLIYLVKSHNGLREFLYFYIIVHAFSYHQCKCIQ